MTTLKVPDMHCEKCVERITNALNSAKLSFQISLKDKTVIIDDDPDSMKIAIEELDDLGFDVTG